MRLVDFIPDNHLCFFVTNLVESLDFKKNERKYKYTKGKLAYSRHMLTRLVIMALVDGIFSSRKIMKLAEENTVYMHLSGMDKPDFRTICRFKIECAEQIEEAFNMTVTVAKNSGMVKLKHIAIEGIKYKKNYEYNNIIMHQYYTNKSLNCTNQLECTGKNRVRIITDYGNVLSKCMALKMETEKGKFEFAKRKMIVEWTFGNIKENLKYTEFLTRGIKQILTENNLISISHNIKRIHNQKQNKNNSNNQPNT